MTAMTELSQRLVLYARLVRLDKPIGILLLLWPTLWALWLAADGVPPLDVLAIFAVGTVLMRSAGCAVNDVADREFDRHVERTRHRPVTSGQIGSGEALGVAAVLSLLAFALIWSLNPLTRWLALPALALAASYPYTKRFFPLPQAYLGIAFGFGIPMAFAAIQGQVPGLAWLLLMANVFWAVAYDTEYAMVDRDDDLRLGAIQSAAITFGRFDVLAVMVCYGAMLGLMALAGALAGLGWPYAAGLVLACALAVYHVWLIRHRERAACFSAFRQNNLFGAFIFAGVAADLALR